MDDTLADRLEHQVAPPAVTPLLDEAARTLRAVHKILADPALITIAPEGQRRILLDYVIKGVKSE